MKVPAKGQIEKIKPVKFREEIVCEELDGAIQNNAGNNEKPEKGSCLPFPLKKGQRMLGEAGRMRWVASIGEKELEQKHQTQLGCSRTQFCVQLRPVTSSRFASFFWGQFLPLTHTEGLVNSKGCGSTGEPSPHQHHCQGP